MSVLVSCLTVSQPRRYGWLQRCVLDFAAQTWQAREQIIVVTERNYFDQLNGWLIQDIDRRLPGRVRRYCVPQVRDLASLYVAACAYAQGNYLAVWDDDNLNSPQRLAVQMEVQRELPMAATVLTNSLYYFYGANELYVTDYQQPQERLLQRCAISSLIVPRAALPLPTLIHRACPMGLALEQALRERRILVSELTGLAYRYQHLVGVGDDNLRTVETHRQLSRLGDWTAAKVLAHRENLGGALSDYVWPAESGALGIYAKDKQTTPVFTYAPPHVWPEGLYPLRPAGAVDGA